MRRSNAGVSIYIHEHFDHVEHQHPVFVAPGQKAAIGIKKFEYKFMHEPWGQCDFPGYESKCGVK